MKNYVVTFSYMVDTDSEEDAVQQTVADLFYAAKHGNSIPLTVQEEGKAPVLIETSLGPDGVARSTPIRREGG